MFHFLLSFLEEKKTKKIFSQLENTLEVTALITE